MKKLTTLLLLLALALPMFAACSDEPAQQSDTDIAKTTAAQSEENATESEYVSPDLDLDGRTVTIFNVPTALWNMNNDIDFEEQTGESLDDAIYERNRKIEELHNFKLNVINVQDTVDYSKMNTMILQDVTSGEGLYDAAYVDGEGVSSLITAGALLNLLDYDELQFSEPWWMQETVNSAMIGNNEYCFFTQSYLALNAFDLSWCVFFNDNMLGDYGLEKPYQLVRDGKWTIDKLREYAKAGASLNGDDSYVWDDNGNSVYGFTGYQNCIIAHIIGAGGEFCVKDSNGLPVLNVESQKIADICEKLADFYGTEGEFYQGLSGSFDTAGSYLTAFYTRRALFIAAEVKASVEMRGFDDTFGLVPTPKYDESQENYRSFTHYNSPLLTIPVTSKYANDTAALLDEMSYMSYKDILPIYYNETVSQKGLRDEESIEMLDIIRSTTFFSADLCYGWSLKIVTAIRPEIFAGNSAVSSIIASNLPASEAAIENMMSELFD